MNDDENAAELSFGAEFDFNEKSDESRLKCLTNDQVYFLLSRQLQKQQELAKNSTETFDQTYSFMEKVATTRVQKDIGTLVQELGVQLRELELERKGDHKMVKLHAFEVASLANLIKAVREYQQSTTNHSLHHTFYQILYSLVFAVFLLVVISLLL